MPARSCLPHLLGNTYYAPGSVVDARDIADSGQVTIWVPGGAAHLGGVKQ